MRAILMLGLGACALAGCHRSQDHNVMQGAAEGPPQMTIATNEGTAAIHIGQASGGLPFGLPAYPRARTDGSIDIGGNGASGVGRVVSFATADPPTQVIAFYTDALRRAGFRVVATMNMGTNAMVMAERNEGEGVHIVAAAGTGGEDTRVQVTAGVHR